MLNIAHNVKHELRWGYQSKFLHIIALCILVFTVWVVYQQHQHWAVQHQYYENSVSSARHIGQDINAALHADAEITKRPDGSMSSENPVRYDYEKLAAAESQISFPGGAAQGMGMACFLLLGPLFMVMGLQFGRHDLQSGGIALRTMTGKGKGGVLLGKAVIIVTLSLLAPLVIGLVSGGGSFILHNTTSFEITEPINFTPPQHQLFLLFLAASGIALAFGTLGLLVAVWTRRMWLSFALFIVLFFLMPILHTFDLRNMLAAIALANVTIVNSFQPSVYGGLSAPLAAVLLAVITVVMAGVTWVRWWKMDKRIT